ncbi:MAG: peptidoglycan DD-metalloendopeptidase family protein [Bacteroidota bacterium]
MRLRLMLSLTLVATVLPLLAQRSATDLRERRQQLIADLAETTELLSATQEQRSAAIQRLNLLQRQIEQRRELIATLNEEIELNQLRTDRNQNVVESLGDDLERLRQEYANTVRAAYRAQRTNSWLAFIFSAESFNSVFRRVNYLRQYQEYRNRQSRLILLTQQMLSEKLEELVFQREEKENLLLAASTQGEELQAALSTQTTLVGELGQSERRLLSRVEQQRREHEQLNRSIEAAIASELEERQRRERADGASVPELAPSVGRDMPSQRGRLLWPVDGEIVRGFGQQPHPDVPSVMVMNGGVDIESIPGARVQAVFAGEVISSRSVPGYRQVLMVRHGDYYTVYSNLDRTSARVGDEVEIGTTIGFMGQDDRPLHFEIWEGRERQDPARWLNR